MSMGAVGESVRPFAGHRLVEALDLAVGARPVRLRGEMADAVAGEQLGQGAVLDVAEPVIAPCGCAIVRMRCSEAEYDVSVNLDADDANARLDTRSAKHFSRSKAGVN